MKTALTRHLTHLSPKEREEFKDQWERLGVLLEPLAKALEEKIKDREKIKEEDFNISNHYALLAYREGSIQMAQEILDLLPNSAKSAK